MVDGLPNGRVDDQSVDSLLKGIVEDDDEAGDCSGFNWPKKMRSNLSVCSESNSSHYSGRNCSLFLGSFLTFVVVTMNTFKEKKTKSSKLRRNSNKRRERKRR
jgi:hypothetical protein